ncbi:hypothetical protein chiPu_0003379 [Chiloscyllium punctatum]|uniref:SHSP domain-containing protein n=1 Tax=Chiloscyllium punctatum TaxID=137246 RepID=A0A401S3M3_CHIPU|nr:hypothetical protein [Chiloscyllium punctatum]
MDSPAPNSDHQSDSVDADASKQFPVTINLGSISPEKVLVKIKDRKMTVSGENIEKFLDGNGAVKFNFHRFSKEFDLPPGVEHDCLTFTVLDNNSMRIEADEVRTEGETHPAGEVVRAPHTPPFNPVRPLTPIKPPASKANGLKSILKKSHFSSHTQPSVTKHIYPNRSLRN